MANARPEPRRVRVGRVLPPSLPQSFQVVAKIASPEFEQWPYHNACDRVNRRDPRGASAANQVRQNGFSLIVRCVRHRDVCCSTLINQAPEKSIAQPACGILQVPALSLRLMRHIGPFDEQIKLVRPGQFRHKSHIFLRLWAPQRVIEMSDTQRDAQFLMNRVQDAKKGHGIGAAGDG